MQLRTVQHIGEIPAADWDRLFDAHAHPVLSHAFLHTLEATGAVGGDTGWQPHHQVIVDDAGQLLAAAPAYLKSQSYGEFVFDWSWANALEHAGGRYYPKLVVAVPFTPVPGPRLLGTDPAALARLTDGLQAAADGQHASGTHLLFADTIPDGWLHRQDIRYVWRNRQPDPYADFDDFLSALTSKRRKEIRRERRRVDEQGIVFETRWGEELSADEWRQVDTCYARTYAVRGQAPYLGPAFFPQLAAARPQTVCVFIARWRSEIVAVAIAIQGRDALFGRHWGCRAELHSLHFETCYYQGIAHCIAHGLTRYDAGVQGAHKLARGFDATMSQSAHHLADPGLRAAVRDFLLRERTAVAAHVASEQQHSAYRQGHG